MVAKIALVECMAAVDNPCVDRNTAHELVDILVWSVLAVLCGADGWEDIELFDKIRLSWLLKFIKLHNDVPSQDTVSRVFRFTSAPINATQCSTGSKTWHPIFVDPIWQ